MCALKRWLFVLFIAQLGTMLVQGETVRGTVRDESGKPASGAHVWATNVSTYHESQRIDGTTDDRGSFRIEVPPGRWILNANLGVQGLDNVDYLNINAGTPIKERTLQLVRNGELRVRMLEDETGKPIVGGTLAVDNGLTPKTDGDGRLQVPSLTFRAHEAVVHVPGRMRKRVHFEMSEKPITELEIRVPAAGKVIGRVLDADGKPIPNAFVGKGANGLVVVTKRLWTKVDDQGRFEYDGLPINAPTRLMAEAEGFIAFDSEFLRITSASTPLTVDFRLKPQPGAQPIGVAAGAAKGDSAPESAGSRDLYGIVRNASKNPVEGATVRWGADGTIETKTDANGKFKLANVPNVSGFVCVLPELSDTAPLLEPVTVRGDLDLDLALEPGHSIKGVVQDAHGIPFVGISVSPSLTKLGSRPLVLLDRRARTDAQGRFEISGLPATGVQFAFFGSGLTQIRDRLLEVDKEHTVVAKAAGSIRGRVVDADGKPVRSFRVLLGYPHESMANDVSGGFPTEFSRSGLSFTSDDGSFLIRNLQANSIQRVTILAAGHGESSLDRVGAVPLTERVAGRELIFKLPLPFNVKVTVVEDSTGKPIPGAEVAILNTTPDVDKLFFVWDDDWFLVCDEMRGRTKADGVARFSPLGFGEGTVTVRAKGFARHHQSWRDDAEELTVRLKPAASMTGRVLDKATNAPLNLGAVFLRGPDRSSRQDITGRSQPGEFHFDELPGGEYMITIGSEEKRRSIYSGKLSVKAGENLVIDFEVSTAGPAR